MVTAILLGMMALLLAAEIAETTMHAVLFTRELRREKAKKTDERVEREMQRAADPIDEGFENIMRFAVNGKTGFDAE